MVQGAHSSPHISMLTYSEQPCTTPRFERSTQGGFPAVHTFDKAEATRGSKKVPVAGRSRVLRGQCGPRTARRGRGAADGNEAGAFIHRGYCPTALHPPHTSWRQQQTCETAPEVQLPYLQPRMVVPVYLCRHVPLSLL